LLAKDFVEETTKQLVDSGKLVEAGWESLRAAVIPSSASPDQLEAMRMAFFAGAQHLFGSIVTMLGRDDGEPTPDDLKRMDSISAELSEFAAVLVEQARLKQEQESKPPERLGDQPIELKKMHATAEAMQSSDIDYS
jgi:hypothetical protein